MEKTDSAQLELFSQTKDAGQAQGRGFSSAFLQHLWNYEKIILIIIALSITSIVSFSLGVEKGKRLVMARPALQVDTTRIIVAPKVAEPRTIEPKTATPVQEEQTLEKEGYIIQLASYKNKTVAQEELKVLKKKGLSALLLPKGKYIILCVGNFANKEKALSQLSELKKRYRDCYMRRL